MSVYNNIPQQCGCNTASKAPCANKIKYIYQFNNGDCKFSCGIHARVNSVYAALNTQDYIMVLKKSSNNSQNTFDVLYHNASCFDVHIHPNLFFGPLNIKHTAKVIAEKFAKEYLNIRTLFRI